jgi:hypothetical protein
MGIEQIYGVGGRNVYGLIYLRLCVLLEGKDSEEQITIDT